MPLVSGNLKPEYQQSAAPETTPEYLGRQAVILGKSIASAAEIPKAIGDIARSGISTGVEKLTGYKDVLPEKMSFELDGQTFDYPAVPGPEIGETGKAIDDLFSNIYTPEQLIPESVGEKTVNRIARGIGPIAMASTLGGMPFLSAMSRNIFSGVAGQAAEEAGLGPLGQFATELGTGIAHDILKKANPASLYKWAKDEAKTNYNKAAPFEKTLRPEIKGLEDKLGTIATEALDIVDDADRNFITRYIRGIDKNIEQGKMPLDRLIKTHRELGKQLYEKSRTNLQRDALRDMYHATLDELKSVAQEHPEWGEPWFTAQGLEHGRRSVKSLGDFFVKNPFIKNVVKDELAQQVLGYGLLGAGLTGAYFGTRALGSKPSIGSAVGAFSIPAMMMAYKSPSVAAHLKDAATGALMNDKAAVINAMRGYNSEIERMQNKEVRGLISGKRKND
jgi:hypothetical protein